MSRLIEKYYKYGIISLFFILTISYFAPIDNLAQIALYDESVALGKGVNWNFNHFLNIEGSPLYSYLYHLEHHFIDNPVSLYYFNNYIVKMSFIGVLFITIYRISNSVMITLMIVMSFIYTFMNVWPLINYFTSTILLIGMLLIYHLRKTSTILVTTLLLTYILSFIRPEFALTFIIVLAINVIYWLFKVYKKNYLNTNFKLIISIYIIIIIAIINTTMPTVSSSKRSLVAIGQHYSLNKVSDEKSKLNPWLNWNKIVDKDFNNPKNIQDFVINNPSRFIWHIKTNLVNSVKLLPLPVKLTILILILYIILLLFFNYKSIKATENKHIYLPVAILSILVIPLLVDVPTLIQTGEIKDSQLK